MALIALGPDCAGPRLRWAGDGDPAVSDQPTPTPPMTLSRRVGITLTMRWNSLCIGLLGCALLARVPAQSTSAVLRGLPPGASNLLVVRDVLPQLQQFLISERLQGLLEDAPALAAELRRLGVAPKQVRQLLGLVQNFVPREIVVGASAKGALAMAQGLTGITAAALLSLPEISDQERRTLTADFRMGVKALQTVSFAGRVVARNERTAESWLDSVSDIAESLGDDAGAQIEWFDDGAKIVLRPSKLQGGRLSSWLSD